MSGIKKENRRIVSIVFSIFGIIFLLSSPMNFKEASMDKKIYDEEYKLAQERYDDIYVCETSESFDRNNCLVDEYGIFESSERSSIIYDMSDIYENTGVQIYLYVKSQSESSNYSAQDVENITYSTYQELSATHNNATNIVVVVFCPDGSNCNYSYYAGDEAYEALSVYNDEFMWDLDYIKDDYELYESYDDEDDSRTAYEETFADDVAYCIGELRDNAVDPEAYLFDSVDYSKEYYEDELKTGLVKVAFGLICFVPVVIFVIKGKKETKTEESNKIWEEELSTLGNSSQMKGFDDIDDVNNPYHDLVEKYGGFEKDATQQEGEKSENNRAGA